MSDLESATSGFELVLREHREFKAMSEELRDFLDRPRPGPGQPGHHRWAAELARRLAELHDKLVLHFHREERDGLFETLTRISPGATRRVELLSAEHRAMLGEVRAVMSSALQYSEGAKPENPHLRRRLVELLDRLKEHEEDETDLMQRLEYRDLGSGD
jgi:hemerythrin